MTPERWREVKTIADVALCAAPRRRSAVIVEACLGDEELKAAVESLLSADDEGTDFLECPTPGAIGELCVSLAAGPHIGRRVGQYRLVDLIAVGGMGAVYRAVRDDGQFDKQVAIKIIHHELATGSMRRRFHRERQMLATLEHPYITRLLDGGECDDPGALGPYLVMEYVEGEPIDRYCATHELSIERRLRLFLMVCEAVQAAHRSLVIHRDLKPSNILVTADGVPKLLDFGISKLIADAPAAQGATLTAPGPMTPRYASPEQVRGDQVTTATDVYSLGVVLYELLAGRPPFDLDELSSYERARVVCEEDPPPPSRAARDRASTEEAAPCPARLIRGDLDTIVAMAMRKNPDRRYASVQQMAEDLHRHQSGRPVIARRRTVRIAGGGAERALARRQLASRQRAW